MASTPEVGAILTPSWQGVKYGRGILRAGQGSRPHGRGPGAMSANKQGDHNKKDKEVLVGVVESTYRR